MEELNLQVKTLHTYPLPTAQYVARTILKWAWIVVCVLLFFSSVLLGGEDIFDGWLRFILAPSIVVLFILFKIRPTREWVDTPVCFRLYPDEFEYVYQKMPIFHASGAMSFVEKTYRMKYSALTEVVWGQRPVLDSVDFYGKMDVWSIRYQGDEKATSPHFSKKNVDGVFRLYMTAEQSAEYLPLICEKLHWSMDRVTCHGTRTMEGQSTK